MDYQIIVTSAKNKKLLQQCNNISLQHNYINGGQLMREGEEVLPECRKIVCAVDEHNKVIGYCGLKRNYLIDGDIYISQIAIDKKHTHQGVGTALIEYVKKNFKNYSFLSAHIKNTNVYSQATFNKEGFKVLSNDLDLDVYVWKNNYNDSANENEI